ncbi:MAG: GNAT family N-acetyltransferase [Candidatus Ornithospirochaeta sp.]
MEVNQRLALEYFPSEDYLEPDKLLDMAKEDNFDFWALLDEDIFVGFMVVQTFKTLSYLFFLAIDPSYRSMEYGSRTIETLKESYKGKKQVVYFLFQIIFKTDSIRS